MGLIRQPRRPARSSDQVYACSAARPRPRSTRTADSTSSYMGMGEPLHNYDATLKALRILGDDQGSACRRGASRVSTVGLVPGIEKLGREPVMPNLAISLHASTRRRCATRSCRSTVSTTSRRCSRRCKRFPLKRRSRITFEYVLLDGRQRHARGRAPPREAPRRHQGQDQPAAVERRAGDPVRAAGRRPRRRLREDPRRQGPDRVGPQEPRPRHPGGVRTADRGRRAACSGPQVGRSGARRTALAGADHRAADPAVGVALRCSRMARRYCAGGLPNLRLKARLNAASDS